MRMSLRILFFVVTLVSCTCCSTTDKNMEVKDAHFDIICKLSNNISELGSVKSLSVFNDGFAVTANPNDVYIYDFEGIQRFSLGNSGNARFEFNNPLIIRSHEDSLYLWSANSLKFIVYSKDGKPASEYTYSSAIRDFVPSKDELIIYNSGVNDSYIIDIYDKNKKEVKESLFKSSNEHKILLSWMSVAPLIYDDTYIIFTSKDKSTVIKYDKLCKTQTTYNIQSQTFDVDKVANIDILQNRRKMSDYLMSNSVSVMLIPYHKKQNLLLTLEGYDVLDETNRTVDYSNRYYALYNVDSGQPKAYYRYESLSPMYLFSIYKNSVYFIRRECNADLDEESYYLCRLKI